MAKRKRVQGLSQIHPRCKDLLVQVDRCKDLEALRWVTQRLLKATGFRLYVQDGGLELEAIEEGIKKLKEKT